MREEYGVRKVWTLGPWWTNGPTCLPYTPAKKRPATAVCRPGHECADVVLDTETAVDIRLQMGRSALDMKGMG